MRDDMLIHFRGHSFRCDSALSVVDPPVADGNDCIADRGQNLRNYATGRDRSRTVSSKIDQLGTRKTQVRHCRGSQRQHYKSKQAGCSRRRERLTFKNRQQISLAAAVVVKCGTYLAATLTPSQPYLETPPPSPPQSYPSHVSRKGTVASVLSLQRCSERLIRRSLPEEGTVQRLRFPLIRRKAALPDETTVNKTTLPGVTGRLPKRLHFVFIVAVS